jgi:error-prone DNA polymerase
MTVRVEDYTHMLSEITARQQPDVPLAHADEIQRPVYRNEDRQAARAAGLAPINPQPRTSNGGHPRSVRILPKSRDFH